MTPHSSSRRTVSNISLCREEQDPATGLTPGHRGPAPQGQSWPNHPRQDNGQDKRKPENVSPGQRPPSRPELGPRSRPSWHPAARPVLALSRAGHKCLGLTPRTHCPRPSAQFCAQTNDHVHRGLRQGRGRRGWEVGKRAMKGSPAKGLGARTVPDWGRAHKRGRPGAEGWRQGSAWEAAEGPSTLPSAPGRGQGWRLLIRGARRVGGERRGLHLPHVPQAAPAGLGRAPAGTATPGAGGAPAGPTVPPEPPPQGGARPGLPPP